MKNNLQIVALRTSETINQEAADWLTKMDGGRLSTGERRALRKWLAEDAEHEQALKRLTAIWADMDFLLNEYPLSQNQESTGMSFLLGWYQWLSMPLVTACTALMIWFAWAYVPQEVTDKPEVAYYSTEIGKRQLKQFSDGSTAHLNTDSIVEIEYTGSRRIVRLLRGEVMFDVVHDPARPFIVYAGGNEVEAIGTRFAVRLRSENIVVIVTDGQIRLTKRIKETGLSDLKKTLPVQEVFLVNKGEVLEVSDKVSELRACSSSEGRGTELDCRFSWLDGQLIFDNERLEQVVSEISRYMSLRIVIVDPELRDLRISGRFRIGDTDALLDAIEVSMNIHISRVGDQFIYLSRQAG